MTTTRETPKEIEVSKGEGHRERLRDRFLKSGLVGFHDYEVLELLLTLGTPRKDTKVSAKELLKTFKSFHRVLEASPEDLMKIKGLGHRNIFGIRLARAVAERYLENRLVDSPIIRNSRELFDYLFSTIRDKSRECFLVLYLNAKNRIIETETLFEGTLTSTSVYPREVVASALRHQAAAVIFAHNHPSGDPTPSPDDFSVTRRLVEACRLVSVTVHEHIVIGNNQYYSFADHGHISLAGPETD